MAVPTNTFQTFQAKGLREDLTDMIYMISPTDVVFQSNIQKGTCSATFHQWQVDSLASVDLTNARVQGDDAATEAIVATSQIGNYTQISSKTYRVSGTLEAVDKAGRARELARQRVKKAKELKRDMEAILLNRQVATLGDATVTPGTLAGLPNWLRSNTDLGAGGVDAAAPNPAPVANRTEGTPGVFTEARLKTALAKAKNSGGDPSMVMMGTTSKGLFSAFAGIATKTYNMSDRRERAAVIGAADIYVGDFHILAAVTNIFQRPRDVFVLDPEMASINFLRGVKIEPLAKTGDSEREFMICEYTLKVMNEAAHAAVFDVALT